MNEKEPTNVATLSGKEGLVTLFSDGEYVDVPAYGGDPDCSEHGNLYLDEHANHICDHETPYGPGKDKDKLEFDIEDLAPLLARFPSVQESVLERADPDRLAEAAGEPLYRD